MFSSLYLMRCVANTECNTSCTYLCKLSSQSQGLTQFAQQVYTCIHSVSTVHAHCVHLLNGMDTSVHRVHTAYSLSQHSTYAL